MELKRCTTLILTVILLSPVWWTPAPADADIVYKIKRDFDSGDTVRHLQFSSGNQSASITMSTMAEIKEARFNISPEADASDPAVYPVSPFLDISGDGTLEWKYQGVGYGPWGMQTLFNDGTQVKNLSLDQGEVKEVRFKLPKDAAVREASIIFGGEPTPFWGDMNTISNTTSHSRMESGPSTTVFHGRLYVAWESKDPTVSDGTDMDIVYRWYDGKEWSPIMEITDKGDTREDDSVVLVVYRNRLYAIWSASVDEDFFSDDDLVMKWTEDGISWSPMVKVSPLIMGGMNDWPSPAVYNGRLYIFWKTTDTTISTDDDMDIVYRWWDGTRFGPIEEVTVDQGELDWAYDVAVYNGRLYLAWETDIGVMTFNVDIMVKSFDGVSWTSRMDMCPADDTVKDEIPKLYVWHNPVRGKDELYLIWGRGNGNQYGTGDVDVVIRVYDGSSWSGMQEISIPNEKRQNMGYHLVSYNGRLYAIWVRGNRAEVIDRNDYLVVYKIWGDILVRSYDGYAWSGPKELTSESQNDEASDPTIAVYNGTLYALWSQPYDNPSMPDGKEWKIVMRQIEIREVHIALDIGRDGTWEWEGNLTSSKTRIDLPASAVQDYINRSRYITDDYGNRITEVKIGVRSSYPAKLTVRDVAVRYNHNITFDIKKDLDQALSNKNASFATMSITAGAEGPGGMMLSDLFIKFFENYPPYLIRPLPNLLGREDEPLEKVVDLEDYFGDDWDDGHLLFRVYSAEPADKFQVVVEGSYLSLYPEVPNWYGDISLVVVAQDSLGLSTPSNRFNITILPVNDPPVLEAMGPFRLQKGERFTRTAAAYDADGDPLTFQDNTTLFDIDPTTGRISFTPDRKGTFTVAITVSDGHGGYDTKNVTFHVLSKTTSAAHGSFFTLLGLVILAAVAVSAVEWYRRHEAPPEPMPERLKPEDSEEDAEVSEDEWRRLEEMLEGGVAEGSEQPAA